MSTVSLPECNRCEDLCTTVFQTSRSSGVRWLSLCFSTSPIDPLIPACRSVLKTLCVWESIAPTHPTTTTASSTGYIPENVHLHTDWILNMCWICPRVPQVPLHLRVVFDFRETLSVWFGDGRRSAQLDQSHREGESCFSSEKNNNSHCVFVLCLVLLYSL